MANPVPNKSDGNANRTPVKWTAYSASGAIEIDDEVVLLTKAGVGTMTLAASTNPDMNGLEMTVTSTTAQAHTVTVALGFNATATTLVKATFGGAIGDSMILRAYAGSWYVAGVTNVTFGTA
ncbi:hypothetical protein LCGC14_1405270 [marine sediment metagenome]|uniref:Uncharacterized protein n=1 Tax=marine sediment metagenome TaxID=412755 RepID=A0A0F9MXF4_9ZZZZ